MKTRRYLLFLLVAIITFLIGVTSAIALGGFGLLRSDGPEIIYPQAAPAPARVQPARAHGCRG